MRGNDNALNILARMLADKPKVPVRMTGTSGATGTDEETEVNTLPVFTEAGKVLTLIVNGDGDLVASWEDGGAGGGTGRYRQFVIELDGSGGFDFILADDGSPLMSLESLE